MSRSQILALNIANLLIVTLMLSLVIYLMCFHAWLIKQNKTTFQWLKDKKQRGESKIVTQIAASEPSLSSLDDVEAITPEVSPDKIGTNADFSNRPITNVAAD